MVLPWVWRCARSLGRNIAITDQPFVTAISSGSVATSSPSLGSGHGCALPGSTPLLRQVEPSAPPFSALGHQQSLSEVIPSPQRQSRSGVSTHRRRHCPGALLVALPGGCAPGSSHWGGGSPGQSAWLPPSARPESPEQSGSGVEQESALLPFDPLLAERGATVVPPKATAKSSATTPDTPQLTPSDRESPGSPSCLKLNSAELVVEVLGDARVAEHRLPPEESHEADEHQPAFS